MNTNETQLNQAPTEETSIFDDMEPVREYYSVRAINGFTLLCGAMYGSVMMAVNFSKTRDKKGIWQVLVFGLAYTVAQVYVSDLLHTKGSGLSLILNAPGSMILTKFFWHKYIGENAPYKPKPVWIPLIIAIVLFGGMIALMIAGAQA